MARWLAVVLACCAVLVGDDTPASLGAARAPTLTKIVPPPDGQTNFGFVFLLVDSSDIFWGDSRPLAARIQDSIQNELAGVYSGSKVIKTIGVADGFVATDVLLKVTWRAPKTQKGKPKRKFCVVAFDVDDVASAANCAPITLR